MYWPRRAEILYLSCQKSDSYLLGEPLKNIPWFNSSNGKALDFVHSPNLPVVFLPVVFLFSADFTGGFYGKTTGKNVEKKTMVGN